MSGKQHQTMQGSTPMQRGRCNRVWQFAIPSEWWFSRCKTDRGAPGIDSLQWRRGLQQLAETCNVICSHNRLLTSMPRCSTTTIQHILFLSTHINHIKSIQNSCFCVAEPTHYHSLLFWSGCCSWKQTIYWMNNYFKSKLNLHLNWF